MRVFGKGERGSMAGPGMLRTTRTASCQLPNDRVAKWPSGQVAG
jgi:hypothetical protein